jgi:cysteine desulfurase
VARCLGASADEVSFTSGGTEGDNLAILGAWRAARTPGRAAVVTAPTEHKAVLAAVHQAAREGAEERLLDVGADGLVDRASFDALVRDDAALCSLMWVNNEIGVIQPIAELAAVAKARGALFHSDAVQAFGRVAIDASATPFDLLTISGHKFGAPKGIGALYVRRGTPLSSLVHGGSQERGRRPGTENVAAAVGLARAAELATAEREAEWRRLEALRDRLEAALIEAVPDAVVHGRGAPRAPHILSVSVPGADSESLLMALDLRGGRRLVRQRLPERERDAVARPHCPRRPRGAGRRGDPLQPRRAQHTGGRGAGRAALPDARAEGAATRRERGVRARA